MSAESKDYSRLHNKSIVIYTAISCWMLSYQPDEEVSKSEENVRTLKTTASEVTTFASLVQFPALTARLTRRQLARREAQLRYEASRECTFAES